MVFFSFFCTVTSVYTVGTIFFLITVMLELQANLTHLIIIISYRFQAAEAYQGLHKELKIDGKAFLCDVK